MHYVTVYICCFSSKIFNRHEMTTMLLYLWNLFRCSECNSSNKIWNRSKQQSYMYLIVPKWKSKIHFDLLIGDKFRVSSKNIITRMTGLRRRSTSDSSCLLRLTLEGSSSWLITLEGSPSWLITLESSPWWLMCRWVSAPASASRRSGLSFGLLHLAWPSPSSCESLRGRISVWMICLCLSPFQINKSTQVKQQGNKSN